MNSHKFLRISVVFTLIFSWIFSGWPRIWQNPRIPPKIQEAWANTTNLVVTSCDVNDIADTGCYNAISADGGTSYALGKGNHIDAPFQTLSAESVTSATLYYDSWGTLSGTWSIYVKDARDGTTICSVVPAPENASETNNSTDCSSITTAQLSNGVWLYVINNDDKGPESVNLDYVRLYVDYNPPAATVSCSTDISSTDFGTWTDTSIKTSSPNASTTMSCSGTSSGCTLYVKDAGSGSNPGLWKSASPTYLISSTDATLSSGADGYGIQTTSTAAGSGGTLGFNSKYNQTGNNVGGLLLTNTTVASSTADVSGREAVVTHKAAISETTLSGDYSDTITYSCLVN